MPLIKNKSLFLLLSGTLFFASCVFAADKKAEKKVEHKVENKDCLECHNDPGATGDRKGKTISVFVDDKVFKSSVHGNLKCVDCHADLAGKELPHDTPLLPVNCGACHSKELKDFDDSLHGRALKNNDPLAPRCANCHGYHDIVPVKDEKSKVYFLNIPYVCGSCHSEGKPVQEQRAIPETHILENYSESIHGEGLFKKGLNVTATCISCHKSHDILPHTNANSSIARGNISKTCMQCHINIAGVHRKVINGELWEKDPQSIPICVDCHQPHKIRKVFYDQGAADSDCMSCHGKKDIHSSKDGHSLTVNQADILNSDHAKISCGQCHTGISINKARPCETITKKVDCSICHFEEVRKYKQSVHGKMNAQGNSSAPSCADCHGTHETPSRKNPASPTYPSNVPNLCGRCHRENQKAAVLYKGQQHQIMDNYIESIHGKGLLKSGLVVTAMCTDCHTAHGELPASDPDSTVNKANIAKTCAKCHHGVFEKFITSVHAPGPGKDDKKLPVCSDCHSAHTIKRTDMDSFKFEIMNACGKCHKDIAESYFQTFHGKVTRLGYAKTAKCQDCHGAHNIYSPVDPRSTLSRENILSTCQKCHPGVGRRFAGYLTHSTHHDPKKYPWIFWTFWGMTILLVGTFTLSGLHTLMWLPRSLEMRRRHPPVRPIPGEKQFVRFPVAYRVMHGIMIISFLTLATTGMVLKFSYTGWAMTVSRILGGVEVTGFIHRCGAVTMFGLFIYHIWFILRRKAREHMSWKELLTGPNTMLFTVRDIKEFVQTVKWYLGKGRRPQYGRWTYWEKFDYFAVFWGILVIGTSGAMLWFPNFFTRFMPGWVINVATIIHSDEALLATGFIFTIHFFNTHFRPEKFPMDKVIFTGRTTVKELQKERPKEYKELVEKDKIMKHLADPMPADVERTLVIFGWVALSIGIALIIGIIYSMIFSYK